MKPLLLVLLVVVLLLPEGAGAKGPLVVHSRVGSTLQGPVAGALTLLRDAGLSLVDTTGEDPSCRRVRGAIVICEDDVAQDRADFLWHHGHLQWAVIRLRRGADWGDARVVVCHELSHVLTNSTTHGTWVDDQPCPFDWRAFARFTAKRHHH